MPTGNYRSASDSMLLKTPNFRRILKVTFVEANYACFPNLALSQFLILTIFSDLKT